jgi:hypothetical protein
MVAIMVDDRFAWLLRHADTSDRRQVVPAQA